jgi:hypothetical protein
MIPISQVSWRWTGVVVDQNVHIFRLGDEFLASRGSDEVGDDKANAAPNACKTYRRSRKLLLIAPIENDVAALTGQRSSTRQTKAL